MMRRKPMVCLAVALLTAGCGDNGTGPSSQIPNVAGSYSGTTSFVFPDLGISGSCPTSTAVTQNGATINIAPIVLGGQCGNLSLPVGQTTIDATGSLVQESGTTTDPSCGVYNYTISGGFFGKELRISTMLRSSGCPNMSMTISLTR